MKIYFAGPLFTSYERSYIAQCAKRLRDAGMEVFVPHEISLPKEGNIQKFVFDIDSKHVLWADAVLALLDGPMVDDGTCVEIGIFWNEMQHNKSKKGIVGLVNDSRIIRNNEHLDGKGINLFVRGAIEDVGEVVEGFDAAFEILLKWHREMGN